MTLPPSYPLFDVQCKGCSLRAQVKTNNSKPKDIIFGAGWDIMDKVLKSGYPVPPLIANFKWIEKGVPRQEIRFYPFIPKTHLVKRQLPPTARRANYKMFNYKGLSHLPHFVFIFSIVCNMIINIPNLLEFLDNPRLEQRRHASSIVGVIGEDLNAAAYAHYRQGTVRVLDVNVTQGSKKGKWLDRWIADDANKILYQCEIKNWSASAIGGLVLPVESTTEEIATASQHYLGGLLKLFTTSVSQPNGVTKVLLPMRRPADVGFTDYELRPLLILWMPVTNDLISLSPQFIISELPFTDCFKEVEVFSVSLYLRSLLESGHTNITLPMPNVEQRINLFKGFMEI